MWNLFIPIDLIKMKSNITNVKNFCTIEITNGLAESNLWTLIWGVHDSGGLGKMNPALSADWVHITWLL